MGGPRGLYPFLSGFDRESPCSPCTRWEQAVQMLLSDGLPHSMQTGFFFSVMVPFILAASVGGVNPGGGEFCVSGFGVGCYNI